MIDAQMAEHQASLASRPGQCGVESTEVLNGPGQGPRLRAWERWMAQRAGQDGAQAMPSTGPASKAVHVLSGVFPEGRTGAQGHALNSASTSPRLVPRVELSERDSKPLSESQGIASTRIPIQVSAGTLGSMPITQIQPPATASSKPGLPAPTAPIEPLTGSSAKPRSWEALALRRQRRQNSVLGRGPAEAQAVSAST